VNEIESNPKRTTNDDSVTPLLCKLSISTYNVMNGEGFIPIPLLSLKECPNPNAIEHPECLEMTLSSSCQTRTCTGRLLLYTYEKTDTYGTGRLFYSYVIIRWQSSLSVVYYCTYIQYQVPYIPYVLSAFSSSRSHSVQWPKQDTVVLSAACCFNESHNFPHDAVFVQQCFELGIHCTVGPSTFPKEDASSR
jgi:hypothetical protein